jgi:hypothetical protein
MFAHDSQKAPAKTTFLEVMAEFVQKTFNFATNNEVLLVVGPDHFQEPVSN